MQQTQTPINEGTVLTAATSSKIAKLLDQNETIRWSGRPSGLPYVIQFFNPFVIVFGLFFAGIGAAIGGAFGNEFDRPLLGAVLVPHTWVGLGIVFGLPLYGIISTKRIFYAITNKRVIIQKGIIGTDFISIDFDKIVNLSVNVGLLDQMFGGGNTGTIDIDDGTFGRDRRDASKHKKLENIDNPYEVFKQLKSVSHDVKTDISYPNALRPEENPGYTTRLKH